MSYNKQIFESPGRVKGYIRFIKMMLTSSQDPQLKRDWQYVLKKTQNRVRYLRRHVWPR